MKRPLYLFFSVLLLAITGCGGGSEDNGLTIGVSPSQTFLLPGDIEFDEDDPCYNSTISEHRLVFDVFQTQWTGEGSFLPIALGIKLVNGGEEQECTLTGSGSVSSFGTLLGYGGSTLENAGDGASATALCSIMCGGFDVEDDQTISFGTEIKLIGIQIKDDGTQVPISARVNVLVQSLNL